MTTVQQQAKALGDPTRHTIYRMIDEATSPIGVAELTDALGLNHNAIRQHLARLVDAGLVIRSTAPADGPGRPRLRYTTDASAIVRWTSPEPYQRLSVLLLEIMRSGRSPEEVGRDAASQFQVTAPSGDGLTDIADAMARQGFQPTINQGSNDDGSEVMLQRCPFASAAIEDRDTVCGLHLGIAQGLAEGTGIQVSELVARDPQQADCLIRLRARPSPRPGDSDLSDENTPDAALTLDRDQTGT